MAIRITAFSLTEALILSLSAIFCTDYFAASEAGLPFNMQYILALWRENVQLGLTMICAAVPIAYLFNLSIMKYVVYPINSMSFLMDCYFSVGEEERARALPDLNIHTGDELEELYHSLQKMVADMTAHIDQRIEQERKSARLTREFMLALTKAVDAKDHSHDEFPRRRGMSLPAETVAITADKAVDCASLSDFDAFGYLRRAAENIIKRTGKAPARFSLANPLIGGAADGSRVGFRASFGLRR